MDAIKGIIGIKPDALKEQEKLLKEQKMQAKMENKQLTEQQSAKVKTLTGSGYGQRSLLSPTRQTLG
ncbi:MAG: hypothetical protein HGA87_01415 [Desulfobulbaceae bacterium]|nr:hypothetical protein [Desulfobulbaceae bacterium]